MKTAADPVRDHLMRVLDWEDAHVGFAKAINGTPDHKLGTVPAGFEHSVWQLVEHIRIAQEDLLNFCVNARYEHSMKWPDDYWPRDPAPADGKMWSDSIASYKATLDALKELARTIPDLTATVPTGSDNQTYLRAILLVADHTAYHVGQIVSVRRALGIWG